MEFVEVPVSKIKDMAACFNPRCGRYVPMALAYCCRACSIAHHYAVAVTTHIAWCEGVHEITLSVLTASLASGSPPRHDVAPEGGPMTQAVVELLDLVLQALRDTWRHSTPTPSAGTLLTQAEAKLAALKADPSVMGLAATPEPAAPAAEASDA